MSRATYILKKTDEDNWSITRKDNGIKIRVHWDYDEIRRMVKDMKIGETRILTV